MHHESRTAPNGTERHRDGHSSAADGTPGLQHTRGKNEVLGFARVVPGGYEKEIQYSLACNTTGLTSSQGILLQWLCFIFSCLVCLEEPHSKLLWLWSLWQDLAAALSFKLLVTFLLSKALLKIIGWVPVGWPAGKPKETSLESTEFFFKSTSIRNSSNL